MTLEARRLPLDPLHELRPSWRLRSRGARLLSFVSEGRLYRPSYKLIAIRKAADPFSNIVRQSDGNLHLRSRMGP